MDPNRKLWYDRQKEMRAKMKDPAQHAQVIELFLLQHAALHDGRLTGGRVHSFADDAWQGVGVDQARVIPPSEEHSFVWMEWHLARIEDVTMNVLVAGVKQVFISGGWQVKTKSTFTEIGNAMTPDEIAVLSRTVDIAALRDYRLEVGRQTENVVRGLAFADMKRKTPADRLQRLLDEKAVSEKALGPLHYWGGLTVAGLLLMPPTKHLFLHINEMAGLKKKLM